MSHSPLAGKKIGILVESQFIPEEIMAYQQEFSALGGEVHLLSRLWGNESLTFWSDPDGPTNPIRTITVDLDIDDRPAPPGINVKRVKVRDYAAIIMAANYTSVRLRFFSPPERPQDAPAVQFFARAMGIPSIVKGALCHGLWILTPCPELLRGRKVICHEVVRADVLNAGGIYTASPDNVVVDNDLVTGHDKSDVHKFIHRIAEGIQGS